MLAAASVLILAAPARAREPIDLVPADSLLCWSGRPLPNAPAVAEDEPSTLQTLFELGTRLAGGSLQTGTQLFVRATEMFGLMIRYPHAVALIDVRAKPIDAESQAKRVDRLRCVLVVQNHAPTTSAATTSTSRPADPFLRVIQKAVNDATDSAAATLVTKRAGAWSYQELRDRRLPDWCVIAWGYIDDCFVLTLGEDVWPSIAAVAEGQTPALGRDPWFAAAREGRARKALVEIYVAVEEAKRRLDPLVDGHVSAFFDAWGTEPIERMHWALGLEGRALFCLAHFRSGDKTVKRLYADPDAHDPRLLSVVPSQARYAVYRLPMGRFLRQFFGGLMSIQGEKLRATVDRIWSQVQERGQFDVERDLLAHLGDHAVLHNDPPHPLRIPIAVTALIEIRDEPAVVRKTLDGVCTAFRDELDQAAAEGRGPPPITLHREDDGLWYMQYGPIAGPAWIVTERFLVTSWSPRALREYLAKAGEAVGGRE